MVRETGDRRVLLNFILYKLLLFEVFTLKKKKLVIYLHVFTFIAKVEKQMMIIALRESKTLRDFP